MLEWITKPPIARCLMEEWGEYSLSGSPVRKRTSSRLIPRLRRICSEVSCTIVRPSSGPPPHKAFDSQKSSQLPEFPLSGWRESHQHAEWDRQGLGFAGGTKVVRAQQK